MNVSLVIYATNIMGSMFLKSRAKTSFRGYIDGAKIRF